MHILILLDWKKHPMDECSCFWSLGPDTIFENSIWRNEIVGRISEWIHLDSEDDHLRKASEIVQAIEIFHSLGLQGGDRLCHTSGCACCDPSRISSRIFERKAVHSELCFSSIQHHPIEWTTRGILRYEPIWYQYIHSCSSSTGCPSDWMIVLKSWERKTPTV